MADIIPNTIPGLWNAEISKGADWPATTILWNRDGGVVIPTSAALTFYVDGTLAVTLNASINGGTGVMTIAGLTAAQTAAINWSYGNLLFRTSESGVITDLLSGNVTVVNRAN
jgi:hypothetical protein